MIRYASADRNCAPILDVIQSLVNVLCSGKMLEIASGTGQHMASIASAFQNMIIQPTEIDQRLLTSINAYASNMQLKNVLPAAYLDVSLPPEEWLNGELSKNPCDYILNVNMMHISEWKCTEGLFRGVGKVLKSKGLFFSYGPYANDGIITPQSNVDFNNSLRSQNSSWGLRDITKELIPTASKYGLKLMKTFEMPANNKILVWIKS